MSHGNHAARRARDEDFLGACQVFVPQDRLANDDAELFVELARERVRRRLARFELAAGEFPQSAHRLVRGALLHEHAPLGIEQRRRDHNGYL